MLLHEICPEEFHIEYKSLTAREEDFFLYYGKGTVFAGEKEGSLLLPSVKEAKEALGIKKESLRYLFSVSEKRFFTDIDCPAEPFGPYEEQNLRFLRITGPRFLAFPAAMGLQLTLWYRRNRFCGRCGAPTVHDEKERMMRCPACGNMIFPQICPSVIVGIRNKGKLLVTKYNPKHVMVNSGTTHAPAVTYALVAGYVESGETPEQAVFREAMEEVGLKVTNIRYYKSQPWPFSSSLLLGYYCDVEGDDTITLEEEELSVAEWKSPEELPDRSMDISLTSEMMEMFRTGKI